MNFINNIVDIFGSATFWIKALEMILALSLLVIIHEFGHYSFARLFKVRVEKFYMFFNPKFSILRWDPKRHILDLFKRNPDEDPKDPKDLKDLKDPQDPQAPQDDNSSSSWRDTIYGIGWVPLGGYCSIAGMIDETTDSSQLSEKAQPWEFRSRPAWQRFFIMVGGVLFNFLLAMVIYAGIVYAVGESYIRFTDATEGMQFGEVAHKAGFMDGDILLAADGKPLEYYNSGDLQAMLTAHTVTVLRNHTDTVAIQLPKDFVFQANKAAEDGEPFMDYRMPVVVEQTQGNMGAARAGLQSGDHILAVANDTTPSYSELTAALTAAKGTTVPVKFLRDGKLMQRDVAVDNDGKLGIQLRSPDKVYNVVVKHYNLLQSIPRGIKMGWDKAVNYVKSLSLVFSSEGAKSLGGFGAIGSIFPEKWNWLYFWEITAFLSVILAVMNILPIPILDGGYVLFLLIEMVTGWKPSMKFMDIALRIGLWLLIGLMLYANLNDIYRFILK